jgi:predicted nucleotidyltransferase
MTIKRDEVLSLVAAHQEELNQLGVKSLDLFGSVARDEAHPESDIDFLIEFNRAVGLLQFIRIRHYLEDVLGRSVDLGTSKALRQSLREPVLKDAIRVF